MPYKDRKKHQKCYAAWLHLEKDAELIKVIEHLRVKTVAGRVLTIKDLLWYMAVALHERVEGEDLHLRPVNPKVGDLYDRIDALDGKMNSLLALVNGIKAIDITKVREGDSAEIDKLSSYHSEAQLLDGIAEQYEAAEFFDPDDDDDDEY